MPADFASDIAQYIDGLETLATALNGYVDALEANTDGIEAKLDTLNSAITALQALVDGLEGSTDGVEDKLDTLAASLTALAGYTDGLEALLTTLNSYVDGLETAEASNLAKLELIRAAVDKTLLVEIASATPLAIADAATASSSKYRGITVRETAGSTAVVRIRNNNSSGTILDTISLAANESTRENYPEPRAAASGTIYVQVVSGTVEGSVFYS